MCSYGLLNVSIGKRSHIHISWLMRCCVGAVKGVGSLLSIAPDDDISVGFRPCALLVGERKCKASPAVDIDDDRGRSTRKAMAEIVTMLVFL